MCGTSRIVWVGCIVCDLRALLSPGCRCASPGAHGMHGANGEMHGKTHWTHGKTYGTHGSHGMHGTSDLKRGSTSTHAQEQPYHRCQKNPEVRGTYRSLRTTHSYVNLRMSHWPIAGSASLSLWTHYQMFRVIPYQKVWRGIGFLGGQSVLCLSPGLHQLHKRRQSGYTLTGDRAATSWTDRRAPSMR